MNDNSEQFQTYGNHRCFTCNDTRGLRSDHMATNNYKTSQLMIYTKDFGVDVITKKLKMSVVIAFVTGKKNCHYI